MRNNRLILIILIGISFFIIISICGADTTNPAIVILSSDANPLSSQIQAGIEDASLQYDFPVTILEPEYAYDADYQVIMAFEAISESPSALVINPSDISLFTPVLKAADARNIPVFILESPLKNEGQTRYIGSDNEAIGVMAADKLASLLNNEGSLTIISKNIRDPSSLLRAESFKKQIEMQYPDIVVVAHDPDKKPGIDLSIESLFNDYPDIQGIFATDGDTTLALGSIIKDLDLQGSVAVVGVDGGDETKSLVTEGIIQEIFVQDPYMIGYRAGELIKAFLQDEEINSDTYIKVTTYTSNIYFTASSIKSLPKSSLYLLYPSSTPVNKGSDKTLSYDQRLEAAAGKYNFNAMSDQNAASHYSTVNQIARKQAALALSMSDASYSPQWYPSMGYNLIHIP